MNHRSTAFLAPILLGSLVLLLPPAVTAQDVAAAHGDGEVLALRNESATITTASGEARRVALPEDVRTSAVVAGKTGWWLAGTVEASGEPEALWLASLEAGHSRVSPWPVPASRHSLERFPVPLVAGGELVALAWLEGDGERSLAVRAALRDGDGWAEPVTVSPPGPGSQVALTGVALGAGDFLLAWSAFDGEDDEIAWSRFTDGAWTEPRALHGGNGIPDVTPALAVVDGVPTAVWSRYTPAGYTLYGARWQGDGWVEMGPVADAGTLFPTFAETSGGPLLTYRRAVPRSWAVARVAPGGAALETAVSEATTRPVPLSADADGVRVLGGSTEEIERLVWEKTP
ncbi:MAG: hypothetical protein KDD11_12045 [Acidobacteria bacterium]|nr:hypothetical protein [Acidobacteriota bacterium]